MPALPGVLVPLMLAFAVCVLLAGVRLPMLRLLLSVGASQWLFHALFVLGAAGGHGHQAHHGHAASGAHIAGTNGLLAGAGGGMLAAHLAAAALTALALRHGELALARLYAALRRLTWRFLRLAVAGQARPTSAPAPLADEHAWVPTSRLMVQASQVRRGPPAGLSHPISPTPVSAPPSESRRGCRRLPRSAANVRARTRWADLRLKVIHP